MEYQRVFNVYRCGVAKGFDLSHYRRGTKIPTVPFGNTFCRGQEMTTLLVFLAIFGYPLGIVLGTLIGYSFYAIKDKFNK